MNHHRRCGSRDRSQLGLALEVLVVSLVLGGCGSGDRPPNPGAFAVGTAAAIPLHDEDRDRTIDVSLWYPAAGEPGALQPGAEIHAGGPYPLIIAAHGIGGTATSMGFSGEHLASHGFVVAAPKFPGSFRDDFNELLVDILEHPGDVSLIIDAALGSNTPLATHLAGHVDPERVGMLGMSYGGLATYLTSFDRELRDPRIKLAATLAGGGGDILAPHFYDSLEEPIPLLMVHGDADALIEYESVARTAFDNANSPRHLLTIRGGTHLGFVAEIPNSSFLHPDRLVCWFFTDVDANDPEAGVAFRHLASRKPDTGVVAQQRAPMPCTFGAEQKPWMPPARQLEITNLALSSFIQTHFGADAEVRRRARETFETAFGKDLESIR